ncbi:LysR family transcriptional regulator [Niallia sp. Krafla_26]|uniref:LysR family transcriptional regulator n=1 Tax=Niallia sp. Krafla_26 TaxID=3064703 RepID=UPI003D183AD6
MDSDQLLTFITVNEFNNYSKAAEYLNLTQPAITARIQKLELELDCKLIYREGKKILLTDEGNALLPFAKKIVNYMNEAKKTIDQLKLPSITIGIAPGISVSIVLEILDILQERTILTFDLFEAEDSYQISRMIFEGKIDIGIVRDIIPISNLEFNHFFSEKLIFVVGKDHPLSQRKEIKNDDLIGQTQVCYRRHTPIAIQIDELLIGVENLHRIEVGSFEMVKSMVKNNWGFSIMPELALGHEFETIHNDLAVIPFADSNQLTYNVTAIYKKESPKLDNLKQTLRIIKDTLHRLLPEKFESKT